MLFWICVLALAGVVYLWDPQRWKGQYAMLVVGAMAVLWLFWRW